MTKLITRPRQNVEFFPRYFRSLASELDHEIQNVFSGGSFTPRVNISEDSTNIYVNAELPGLSKDDVKVVVADGLLTIRGEKSQETKQEGRNYHRIERRSGEFVRQFTLPENVNDEAMRASFANGVLEVVIPKKEPEKPKEREIQISIN
ncbi:MAG TPA: Hsp20/alpha crystallin family protein [Candidatus Kapabacteria bacterium]|nr:Hsp20/alpha crystallin family protein [Candidatus Kapabacteria bacterium]